MPHFHAEKNNKFFDIDEVIKPVPTSLNLINANSHGSNRSSSVEKAENLTLSDPNSNLCKRRWLTLMVFCFTFTINVFHLSLYDDLEQALTKFYYPGFSPSEKGIYSLNKTTLSWLSILHVVINLLFIFPAIFLLEFKGFRKTFLVGSVLTALGSWIKCNSIRNF